MVKPEPVVTTRWCSICHLDWDKHGDDPTIETCVKLLLFEVARLRALKQTSRPIHTHTETGYTQARGIPLGDNWTFDWSGSEGSPGGSGKVSVASWIPLDAYQVGKVS